MDHAPLRVAIIGGGVSGLSLAYYLQKYGGEAAQEIEVTLFERKTTLGGNAATVWVDLGSRRQPGQADSPYRRWADLGVNDVNLATYHHLHAVLEEIGELDRMKPLENTESYFSRDGRIALTDDDDLLRGVSDPAHELSQADGGKLAPLISVVHQSALDLVESHRITPRYTVGDFFDGCVADPVKMLATTADRLRIPIDWQDPELPARLERIRHTIYYPRISAMYFADDLGPAGMPLQAPFEYYRIQEGGTPPDRRYFDHGAQHWLEALATHITEPAHPGPRVEILRGLGVEASLSPRGVTLTECTSPGARRWEADLLIMATHAEDALPMLTFGDGLADTHRALRGTLGKVRYTRSFGVCHTSAARLPPNRNLWRTYNIEVRDPEDTFFPYRIDYVANRHQNDAANPAYDGAGLPQYFVSLVDDLNQIPRSEMLERHPSPLGGPAALAGDPGQAGYRDRLPALEPALEAKAWTLFKHNVLDADCLEAQAEIAHYNLTTARGLFEGRQGVCPLLFAGGWTRGAGLQEQCLEQSAHIIALLLGNGYRPEP
ncbi:FAD-dependent oxidoreductase [Halomonas sp. 328]|uniref:FAD-dependent oxidoreductase n=1 Tax=Halomonas sp. 328 TaxID=2776704 RepID=UPI0018A70506|nr:FAD-dependent oxidoreductase [Halomonas sp. 328]MBF8221893.1 FAD-dependent oxidoreductase [Halomonas sp. 328]